MSKFADTAIHCSKCGTPFEVRVMESCNVTLDPSLKEKIVTGAAFRADCPACQTDHSLVYPCLYHDMDKRIMIYFLPDYEGGEWTQSLSGEDPLHSALAGRLTSGGYTLRLESDHNAFTERVRILDSGLDDILFELVRALLFESAVRQNPDLSLLYFIGVENGDFLFQGIVDGKGIGTISAGRDLYDEMLPLFSQVSLQDAFQPGVLCRMNPDWLTAHDVLGRLAAHMGGN